MHRRRALLALALAAGVASCTVVREHLPGPDAPFIPTPEEVSLQMLQVAGVVPDDIVFDLGSGDGRVVIAAARDFGARGVGVEIDPQLVSLSRDAALAAGVASRVAFLWQDLFKVDLTAATVVTLYLSEDVNLRLRPKLVRELPPGTRVVSHDFDMGDWEPDRVQPVRSRSREHRLYLWLVPAAVAGAWQSRIGAETVPLVLTQHFQKLAGTLGDQPATGRLSGARIELSAGSLTLRGVVSGDVIEGEAAAADGPIQRWTARRTG
jgi:SAM-dependent methyltransferase